MKMDFDSEQIVGFLKLLKLVDTELMSYRAVYEAIERSGRFPDLVLFLESAKSAVRQGMDLKYDPTIEALSKAPNQEALDRAFREFLVKSPSKGQPN